MSHFNNSKLDNSLYLEGNNTSKQLKKKKNDFQDPEQDITISDNLENKLLDPLEEKLLKINSGSIEILHQLRQAGISLTFYPSQIIYNFIPIS